MSDYKLIDSCIFESPLGKIRLHQNQGYLVGLSFVSKELKTDIHLSELSLSDTKVFSETSNKLERYFSGNLQDFNIPIKVKGTSFERSAWRALLRIPYGETWSYSKQANFINKPEAIRAIGNANSKNPMPIIIPCHRVIGKDGYLKGYSSGIEKKSYLIDLEKKFMHVHKN
tara:strand:- start:530 stop:1042 length:513 start_codon:yes stop_codon:yes gene_type:complete